MPGDDDKTSRGATAVAPDDDLRDDDRLTEDGMDAVDQAIFESFPASDPPSFTPGHP